MYPDNFKVLMPQGLAFSHYNAFSRCPNADACAQFDNYVPACEQVVFSPRCLVPVFEMLDGLRFRVRTLEDKLIRNGGDLEKGAYRTE